MNKQIKENKMLTYEQWRNTISVNVDNTVEQCLKEVHGIDASGEIERALHKEYDEYVKACKDERTNPRTC